MEKKKTFYEKQATKKNLLDGITSDLETKGDVKNSAIETVKDLVVGVLGGGIVGSAIGRASLAIGTIVTGIGHYTKSRLASIFGIGMMAAGGFSQDNSDTVEGTEKKETDMIDGVKDRMLAFKDHISKKLFLDKILKSKKQDEKKDESVGDVKYFTPPAENKQLEEKENDTSVLDHIEKQLAENAEEFSKKKENVLSKNEMGEIDPAEKNF